MEKMNYITVDQLAARLRVSARRVQQLLAAGKPIRHVRNYRKLDAEKQTSPYLIEPAKSFFAEN